MKWKIGNKYRRVYGGSPKTAEKIESPVVEL